MTLEGLSKRIKTTTDLKGIVSTMKMLSSVSIAQYEKALVSILQYRKTLEDAFLGLMLNSSWLPKNILREKTTGKILMILIGTDNGLVGRFNRDILIRAAQLADELGYQSAQTTTLCVGRKLGLIASQTNPPQAVFAISNSIKEIASIAGTLLVKIDELALKERIETVFIVYNEKEKGRTKPQIRQLMPLSYHHFKELKNRHWEGKTYPLLTLDSQEMLGALSKEYLSAILTHALTASLAAEHYARMLNMQQAEKNINDSLSELELEYQQARQNAITDELIDIVSGAESLTQKK